VWISEEEFQDTVERHVMLKPEIHPTLASPVD
jgi:hypothetical protein